MVVAGLALIVGSSALAQPLLMVAGLVLVASAYVVPGLVSSQCCSGPACSATTSPPRAGRNPNSHHDSENRLQEEEERDG